MVGFLRTGTNEAWNRTALRHRGAPWWSERKKLQTEAKTTNRGRNYKRSLQWTARPGSCSGSRLKEKGWFEQTRLVCGAGGGGGVSRGQREDDKVDCVAVTTGHPCRHSHRRQTGRGRGTDSRTGRGGGRGAVGGVWGALSRFSGPREKAGRGQESAPVRLGWERGRRRRRDTSEKDQPSR